MNGIAGVFHLDGRPVDPSLLQAPMRAMAHRSEARPDTVVLGSVGLTRHASVTGNVTLQPQLLARGGLAIVADARLDGRDELCDALEVAAGAREAITDAELLLGSYQRWGSACPEHVIGDYAFAIWDGARRTLVCARDHVGARPFYFARVRNTFAFASEIEGVLAFAGLPALIDEAEIARYLLSEPSAYFDPAQTFFADVRKLPFGHRLQVDPAGLQIERYWRPENLPEVRFGSADDYAQRLFELVNEALMDRLRGARQVGVHLSGGLDSSSLAVMAARTTRARGVGLTAFSWAAPPTEKWRGPEHERLAAVATAEGLVPVYLPNQKAEAWRFDRDIAVRSRHGTFVERPVVEAAVASGVDVIVSGWGGDEAASYNGRGIAAEHLAKGHLAALARYCFERAATIETARPLRRLGYAASVAWHEACLPWLPRPLYRTLGGRHRQVDQSLIAKHFLQRIHPKTRPPIKFDRDVPGGRASMLHLYSIGNFTGRIESWQMFRTEYGVTHVYPLTDRRVLEFIYASPPELHVQHGLRRYLFRQAMKSVLPAEWLWGQTKREQRREPLTLSSCAKERDDLLASLSASGTPTPHPWVDIEGLRRALMAAPTHKAPPIPVDHALAVMTVWRNWCGGPR